MAQPLQPSGSYQSQHLQSRGLSFGDCFSRYGVGSGERMGDPARFVGRYTDSNSRGGQCLGTKLNPFTSYVIQILDPNRMHQIPGLPCRYRLMHRLRECTHERRAFYKITQYHILPNRCMTPHSREPRDRATKYCHLPDPLRSFDRRPGEVPPGLG